MALGAVKGESVNPNERIALQPPGESFKWPKGVTLTPLEEVIIAIPGAILGANEKIQSVIDGNDRIEIKMKFGADDKPEAIYLKVQAGMSVKINKTCEAMVLSDNPQPKRIKIEQ
jgi:hypothetical protein